MKYQSGSVGRVFVARFEDGEDFLTSLCELARKENVRAGVFHLVGGAKKGRVVVGPKGDEMPPDPMWREIEGNSEIVGTGTIFWAGLEPKAHLHMAAGRGDRVCVGCLRQNSQTFLVLEAVLMEITGVDATRELDPGTGLALLKL
jgi:predicted DNA-binding protein with PD1-like motif